MTERTIDLKTTHNSSNNFMRPQLNEDNISRQESIRPRLLESDLNLLGNPKKTKKFTSSSEESDSIESDVSTEFSDDNIGLSQNPDELLGKNFDPFSKENSRDDNDDNDDDDNDDESESSGSGSDAQTTSSTSSSVRKPPQRAKTLEEIAVEKQELLYRLERLEANGFKPSRKFNMRRIHHHSKKWIWISTACLILAHCIHRRLFNILG